MINRWIGDEKAERSGVEIEKKRTLNGTLRNILKKGTRRQLACSRSISTCWHRSSSSYSIGCWLLASCRLLSSWPTSRRCWRRSTSIPPTPSYRPISNMSVLSKLLERIVARQLIEYLKSSKLLPRLQSANTELLDGDGGSEGSGG